MIMARPFRRAAVAETVLAQILASFRLQPLQIRRGGLIRLHAARHSGWRIRAWGMGERVGTSRIAHQRFAEWRAAAVENKPPALSAVRSLMSSPSATV